MTPRMRRRSRSPPGGRAASSARRRSDRGVRSWLPPAAQRAHKLSSGWESRAPVQRTLAMRGVGSNGYDICHSFRPRLGCGPVAHGPPVELAGEALGQLAQEVDRFGDLVGGDPLLEEPLELLLGHSPPFLEGNV